MCKMLTGFIVYKKVNFLLWKHNILMFSQRLTFWSSDCLEIAVRKDDHVTDCNKQMRSDVEKTSIYFAPQNLFALSPYLFILFLFFSLHYNPLKQGTNNFKY